MKSLAFFSLLLFVASATAQTPAEHIKRLQNDPNIIWISEIYRDYEDLDRVYEGRNIDRIPTETLADGSVLHNHKQSTTFLKLQSDNVGSSYWENYLIKQLVAKNVKSFADADLTKPLSEKEKIDYTFSKDTISVFNPETQKQERVEVVNELDPTTIYGYRLRQLIYYNAKENMYYNLPLSLAPLQFIKNDKNKNIGLKALFWVPILAIQEPIMPKHASNMPYIKSVRMQFPFQDMKPLKETKAENEVKQLWFDDINKQKDKIFATGTQFSDDEKSEIITAEQLTHHRKNTTDTISVYDPITFIETKHHLVRMPLEVKNVIELRINQTIGWDSKKQAITMAMHSIAPIVAMYDDNKNLLFTGPLFYLYPYHRFKTVK